MAMKILFIQIPLIYLFKFFFQIVLTKRVVVVVYSSVSETKSFNFSFWEPCILGYLGLRSKATRMVNRNLKVTGDQHLKRGGVELGHHVQVPSSIDRERTGNQNGESNPYQTSRKLCEQWLVIPNSRWNLSVMSRWKSPSFLSQVGLWRMFIKLFLDGFKIWASLSLKKSSWKWTKRSFWNNSSFMMGSLYASTIVGGTVKWICIIKRWALPCKECTSPQLKQRRPRMQCILGTNIFQLCYTSKQTQRKMD